MNLCTKCKERLAVLYIGNGTPQSGAKGYCLPCASELGIKPVNDMLTQMGITQDAVEEIQGQMTQIFEGMDPDEMRDALEDAAEGMSEMVDFEDLPGDLNTFFEQSGLMPPDVGEEVTADGLSSEESHAFDQEGKYANEDEKKDAFSKMREQMMSMFSGGDQGGENMVEEEVPKEKNTKNAKKPKRKFLDGFCTNLNQRAKDGKIDRVIGREDEIARAIQILNRRTKNNPCLIGEPGVGKTAIAEGIASAIVNKTVPMRLQNKIVFQLDLTSLVAGTQFRGQFETRVKGLLEEIVEDGNIILFVDELHNLVGAGEAEGAMSAANIFKPALSRGEIQIVGATTFTEYRKYIEKDSALERRFQPIKVEEPNIEETIEILRGIKDYYEQHHHVKLPNRVIRLAAVLSERYITDRFLPDKAIDLLDEAGSYRSLASPEIDALDAEKQHHTALEKEIASLSEEQDGEIDYETIVSKRVLVKQSEERIAELSEEVSKIKVSEDDIARVIELWTGISYAKVKESDLSKISDLEERLSARIIGQDEAVQVVADAVKRSRVQISPRRRPASFIFVGPTAVGKTELVKVLADELFDTPDTLIRMDMSEYMEQHSVSKMIGSPPGYVGYDEAGQLTEQVRRKPYSVILFDEIEKAHPNVMNILLQILDEGHITDSQGRKVNFENTVIVMTSNAGSQFSEGGLGFGKTSKDISVERARKGLSEFLRPEFLGRVDEIVIFNPLSEENYAQIAGLALAELKKALVEKDIMLSFGEDVKAFIAKKTYRNPAGAREVRNFIRKHVEDRIASIIIASPENYAKDLVLVAEDEDLAVLDTTDVTISVGARYDS